MELSLKQAATMMGISPRTLRDRLARGDVVGAKRGGRWFVDSHRMPLTEVQRISMQARAAEIRGVVEAALPSRAAATRERKHRSVADLDVFREARNVAASMRACADGANAPAGLTDALEVIDSGLLDLAEGVHAFDRDSKLLALRAARRCFGRAVGFLLRSAGEVPLDPALAWVVALETRVLASLAGLLRWAEKLEQKA